MGRWSWMRSLAEWARSGRGRALAADVWRGAALGAASVLGTARALHACDAVLQAGARRGGGAALAANLFSSLLIGIIVGGAGDPKSEINQIYQSSLVCLVAGALNGLLTTWMLLKIQEHQSSWQAWRDSTLHVHVTLAEDRLSPRASTVTVVGDRGAVAGERGTADRSTNVADPFMVALPYTLPDP
ncbi:unnamed protein product [Diatraea saccharalis]|uniref:Uncharacterized protein n=1 Tax=Diatraea saccharalis TaxID=40085 RepID=A0A9N9WAE2_9NEOP|nr:unnamed protein product [Diatraea saccharalis]